MTVACAHCGETLEFRSTRPKFCGFCGLALPSEDSGVATTAPGSRESPTIAHTPSGHDVSWPRRSPHRR